MHASAGGEQQGARDKGLAAFGATDSLQVLHKLCKHRNLVQLLQMTLMAFGTRLTCQPLDGF